MKKLVRLNVTAVTRYKLENEKISWLNVTAVTRYKLENEKVSSVKCNSCYKV